MNTPKPKKQQTFIVEVAITITDGTTWTKKAVRESITRRLNPPTAACKARVRKIDLD